MGRPTEGYVTFAVGGGWRSLGGSTGACVKFAVVEAGALGVGARRAM